MIQEKNRTGTSGGRRDRNGLTEAEAIAVYRTKNYPKPALTANIVVLCRQDGELRLLMIRRGGHPYLGCWALPGGFADEGETIEKTAARELEEETGIRGLSLRLTGIYSAPGRDPRGWTVSAAYAVWLPDGALEAAAGDDAAEAQWIPVRLEGDEVIPELPDQGRPAFDHLQIITDAVLALRPEIEGQSGETAR
ncbi:MAG: NUDIX hydrolase [Mogibacterium sp.]|nr:NUDIX hydrolase [Mogibacterium sp.]